MFLCQQSQENKRIRDNVWSFLSAKFEMSTMSFPFTFRWPMKVAWWATVKSQRGTLMRLWRECRFKEWWETGASTSVYSMICHFSFSASKIASLSALIEFILVSVSFSFSLTTIPKNLFGGLQLCLRSHLSLVAQSSPLVLWNSFLEDIPIHGHYWVIFLLHGIHIKHLITLDLAKINTPNLWGLSGREFVYFFNQNGRLILSVSPEEQRLVCVRAALVDVWLFPWPHRGWYRNFWIQRIVWRH